MVDVRARQAADWRPNRLAQLRALIKQADPAVEEEVKWRKPSNPEGVPVWSHGGIICVGSMLEGRVRLTFFKGAALKDPSGPFNAHLTGVRRAIDLYEDDHLDEAAFRELIQGAVGLNVASRTGKRSARTGGVPFDKQQ
jgi:hypothetical protein